MTFPYITVLCSDTTPLPTYQPHCSFLSSSFPTDFQVSVQVMRLGLAVGYLRHRLKKSGIVGWGVSRKCLPGSPVGLK